MSVGGTVTIQHSELGVTHQVPVLDFERATPAQLLSYLQRQGVLPQDRPERPYLVIADSRTLATGEPFARQGLGDGAVLTVITRGMGAGEDGRMALVHEPERAAPATLTVQHAESGTCDQVPVSDLGRATPRALMQFLVTAGVLPAERADRPYLVLGGDRTLAPDEPFTNQGVADGAVLTVITRGLGAATDARRFRDHATMVASFPPGQPGVERWTAYRSVASAESRRPTTDPALAAVYDVTLRLRSPTGPDRYHDEWTVRIDASHDVFPHKEPNAHFRGRIRPWNPHVRPTDGWVCPGTLWLPTKLIAFYVLDILRLLNFDFGVTPAKQDGHFQPEAVEWWRDRHRGAPITPRAYPTVLTPELQDLVAPPMFGPVTTSRG